MRGSITVLALAAGVVACSAPARNTDLATAAAAERSGDFATALAAYEEAQAACHTMSPGRQRRQVCAEAYLHHAELLDRMGREADAARAYEHAARVLAEDPTAASTATYRAGRLHLELDAGERGYELLWRTITHFPDQAHAADALQLVVIDGRRRNPAELYRVLGDLVTRLAHTAVADRFIYALADLAEHELDDPRTALAMYDKIVTDYPDSGLRDDAWWHGARLARALGDSRGAARRLRALLDTREVARIVGSYFSVWLDDAQLTLGRILRDDLGELDAAAAAFARLPEDYPDSILIDDALWELAHTWAQAGNTERVCATLARLGREYPESRYEITLAPALRRAHGCAAPGR